MRRLLLATTILAAGLAVAGPSAAGAKGGWAVASYDPMPELTAGETVAIGFRLLQHGVTPIDAADWPAFELRLDVTANGETRSFTAVPDSTPGHFVATVAVPEASTVALSVEWPNGLLLQTNAIEVPVRDGSTAPIGPTWLPPVLAVVGLACAGVLDVARARRARRTAAITV